MNLTSPFRLQEKAETVEEMLRASGEPADAFTWFRSLSLHPESGRNVTNFVLEVNFLGAN